MSEELGVDVAAHREGEDFPFLENMNTEELLEDNVSEFLFTLGPARLTGAVQAIINPIGIK